MKFDEFHCHKWAILLRERKQKIEFALNAINHENFETAKKLILEVFHGGPLKEKSFDPGMFGSLLYHMAMVTKMAAESKIILETFKMDYAKINSELESFYEDFLSDAKHLTEGILKTGTPFAKIPVNAFLYDKEKVKLLKRLTGKLSEIEKMLEERNTKAAVEIQSLFQEWALKIVEMRLRQEYETIKGFLTACAAAEKFGLNHLKEHIKLKQEEFGKHTVRAALEVSLKVGMKRDQLDKLMLSDHYIERKMDIKKFAGVMRFLNCPIFGNQKYLTTKMKVNPAVASLFCRYFCFAHAKAMLNMVIPFPFDLTQPKTIAKEGVCEFNLKMAGSKTETHSIKPEFLPLVISWNITLECNLKCSHCYINASNKTPLSMLSTEEAENLIDQIAEISRPLLILSGGEPLLRQDIFEIIRYSKEKGFKVGLGSNGTLICEETVQKLKKVGVDTVSISLDSVSPEKHDEFRGVKGSWKKAVNAIKVLRKSGILTQVNTTVTRQNYNEIGEILALAEELGAENFHLFFLVPTGRGVKIENVTPEAYEEMIQQTLKNTSKCKLNVKFSCAPQFMRIAQQTGMQIRHVQASMRGCIAGLYYCRIYPTGDVTPCPYMPIKLGNIRDKSFKEIWFNSQVFKDLRDPEKLKGKCGICEYKYACGGCRARAYGLTSNFIDFCGDLHEPAELKGDYLAEEPWCIYEPKAKKRSER